MTLEKEMTFVIPTHRLREVGETVQQYDENFWHNGRPADIIVFDDSSLVNHQKYFPALEQIHTANDLYYVGPAEKEEFVNFLCKRLRDAKLNPLVRNLFRPSYGGNRNFTLMYTLGQHMISSDDDMRPYALIEDSLESLNEMEICRGKLIKSNQNGHTRKSFDILGSFADVLGRPVSQVPENYAKGDLLTDTSMDLETNSTKGFTRENSLILAKGKVTKNSIVKIAQTFRSGTNDIDAVDYVDMYLDDETQTDIESLNDRYVLVNFRPVITNKNWRMDCGVAGYNNTVGLPPFFPTRLRFEDYLYRLWIQQTGIVAAHVDSAQTHIKSNYMRNPMAAEVFNEEICNLLKRKIKSSVTGLQDLSIHFAYDGEVTVADTEEILEKISALYKRVLQARDEAKCEERKQSLHTFAINLERAFYSFEPDFFQQNVSRIVDDVISQIKASLELWPTLVEIVYFQKSRKPLPMVRVKNKKARSAA